jgi:hypothetical protein
MPSTSPKAISVSIRHGRELVTGNWSLATGHWQLVTVI